MYDELVKRLREADEKSMCGECGLNLHTGATKKGVLFAEAADAIESLSEDNAALNGTVTNLLEQIKELGKPRWIPVTERLPEPYQPVLVCVEMIGKGKMYGVDYRLDNITWAKSGEFWKLQVTHWMPLPPVPKEG